VKSKAAFGSCRGSMAVCGGGDCGDVNRMECCGGDVQSVCVDSQVGTLAS
jgi:hypothetical protein